MLKSKVYPFSHLSKSMATCQGIYWKDIVGSEKEWKPEGASSNFHYDDKQ